MMNRLWSTALAVTASAFLAVGQGAGAVFAAQPLQGQNPGAGSTINEDFEGVFTNDSYCSKPTCMKPEGWGVWFIPRRDSDPQATNVEPTFAQITAQPVRVKSGNAALRQYTENATHTGGIYRIINDIKPGSRIRFTINGQVWSTNDNNTVSSRPSSDIKLRVGIDPMGGNNGKASPLNGQVVWSSEQDAKDKFVPFTVEAEAKSPTVIVYTYASMKDPVRHNEIFWDTASVEILPPVVQPVGAALTNTINPTGTLNSAGTSQSQSQPAQATPAAVAANSAAQPVTQPAQKQAAAPAAAPAGGVKYKVKSGDTLSGIAIQYNVTVDQIRKLNNMQSDFLSIDQELVIQAPALPPTPTPAPTPVPVPVAQAAPGKPESSGPGKVCVRAFFDLNGNGKRDDGEDLVPNVAFALTSSGAVVGSYTSDGVNEPHCFESLSPGNYIAQAIAPPNYNPTNPMNDSVTVPGGGEARFDIGLRRVSDGTKVIQPTVTANTVAAAAAPVNVPGILAVVAGVVLIGASVGAALTLFLRRRRI